MHLLKRDCHLVLNVKSRTRIVQWGHLFPIVLVVDTERKVCLPIPFMYELPGLQASLLALFLLLVLLSNSRATLTTTWARVFLVAASLSILLSSQYSKLRRISLSATSVSM